MSTIKSSDEHLTLNADGSSKDIKFQANGVEKASISSAGAFTSTTIDATKLTGNLPAISGANLTGLSSFDPDGAVTSNDSGAAVDFRVESDGNANMIQVDGTNNRVGIGVASPGVQLANIAGTGTNIGAGGIHWNSSEASKYVAQFRNGSDPAWGIAIKLGISAPEATDKYIDFIDDQGVVQASLTGTGEADGGLAIQTAGTERLKITEDGRGLSQFTAKAWIHISNNATINDSHNISSLSDMTTGRMKIYFSNNPGGSNYSISAITSKNGGGASSSNFGRVCIPEDKYSSYFQLFTQLGTSNTDTVYTSAVIFGD